MHAEPNNKHMRLSFLLFCCLSLFLVEGLLDNVSVFLGSGTVLQIESWSLAKAQLSFVLLLPLALFVVLKFCFYDSIAFYAASLCVTSMLPF